MTSLSVSLITTCIKVSDFSLDKVVSYKRFHTFRKPDITFFNRKPQLAGGGGGGGDFGPIYQKSPFETCPGSLSIYTTIAF